VKIQFAGAVMPGMVFQFGVDGAMPLMAE